MILLSKNFLAFGKSKLQIFFLHHVLRILAPAQQTSLAESTVLPSDLCACLLKIQFNFQFF